MPWCPKCKDKFSERHDTCNYCGETLIPDEQKPIEKYNDIVLLTTVSTDIEATVLESLLRSEQIPCMVQYKHVNFVPKVYTSFTKLGVDIFVPEPLLQKAQEVISESAVLEPLGDDVSNSENDSQSEEGPNSNKMTNGGYIFIVVFLAILIILLIAITIASLQHFG